MQTLIKCKSDLGAIILCLLTLALVASATSQYNRLLKMQTQCASNLSGMGKAMLIYANDYEDEFPKGGGRVNNWAYELPDWQADSRREAFNIQNLKGEVTVSSNLYLLVKYAEVTPEEFICPGDRIAEEFTLVEFADQLELGVQLIDLWDFGTWLDLEHNPSTHCSYAYHWPFDAYALTSSSDHSMVIAADRNPWMDPNRTNDPYLGWDRFDPDSNDPDAVKLGNSENHLWAGQNVLFVDSHVNFETTPHCGLENDNIYSIQDPAFNPLGKGLKPQVYSGELETREDSMLVQGHGNTLPASGSSGRGGGR